MPSDEWRARHLLFSESELDRVGLLQLRGSKPGSPQARALGRYVVFLKVQRAEAICAAELYARSLPLEQYLAKVRDKMVRGGIAPAAAEYVQYRGELDALHTAMDAKRTATLAVLTPPPPPKAQSLPTLSLIHI